MRWEERRTGPLSSENSLQKIQDGRDSLHQWKHAKIPSYPKLNEIERKCYELEKRFVGSHKAAAYEEAQNTWAAAHDGDDGSAKRRNGWWRRVAAAAHDDNENAKRGISLWSRGAAHGYDCSAQGRNGRQQRPRALSFQREKIWTERREGPCERHQQEDQHKKESKTTKGSKDRTFLKSLKEYNRWRLSRQKKKFLSHIWDTKPETSQQRGEEMLTHLLKFDEDLYSSKGHEREMRMTTKEDL